MSKEIYTWLVISLWLTSASSCICCDAFKSWKFFHLFVSICLFATFLLPMLIHTKNGHKPSQEIDDKLSVEDAMSNVIAKMRELKAERRDDE